MTINKNCLFVSLTGIKPFKRCEFCEKPMQECFGIQFFIISSAIIILLAVTFFISDLPVLVIDTMIVISLLVALLAFLASKETNEIVLNNALLSQMNKELEDKVKQRTEQLERSNEELKSINQMKNDFIGIINHEMKTPITAVISGTELIKARGTDKFDESQKKMLDIIDKSSYDMLRLTNDLLDLSRIESGKIEINPDHVPLISLVEEVLQSLKPEATRKQINIGVTIDKAITLIYVDPQRFKQILFNLTDNAIKYTKNGGSIRIIANDSKNSIKIEVEDNGIGIKKEYMNKVFNKFSRSATEYSGTGLGLYITKTFVEAHKGKIEVSSDPGKGTKFTLYLPKAA
jgi:signal transduction histidine kinase